MDANTRLTTVQEKYRSLAPIMDERMRRRWAASEARALGWGGIALIARATGLSPVTIRQGLAELKALGADPAALPARGLGGHEEEGIGRGFQERRSGMAAGRGAGGGPLQGFQGQGAGQGRAVWRV